MSFKYEIDTKLGGSDQVGLRLQCNGQSQAEEIHRGLRQAGFRVTNLMASKHSGYTHFVYITSTETELRNAMLKLEADIRALADARDVKVLPISQEIKVPNAQKFKSWQNQFRKAVRQLNSDSPRITSSVQEIDRNRLEQQIAAGRTIEVEEQLLRQATINDGNTLRALIALYARTEQSEQLVELCKSKRSEVLALPVSGRMVEQLVSAHLQHYQQTNTLESLRVAQEFAQEFLPELERLRQANGLRQLLHQPLISQELLPTLEGATLSEQLARLLEIEPGERIPQLESLQSKYSKATNILLALADSYAAIDNTEYALEIYQSFLEQTEEVKQRRAELLLASQRFQEVIALLPDSSSDLSPTLVGLRGAALYHSGQKTQAREFLEKAWQRGERSVQILLPLARLWATVGDPEKAGAVYQILQETANENLVLEDYAHIAMVANLGGFGDIDDEQKIVYYEQCVSLTGKHLLNLTGAEDILKDRLELWKSIQNVEGILNAYADYLDWLANAERWEDLEKELAELRNLTILQQISHQQYFELLESLEIYIDIQTALRQSLANDYFGLALAEIDRALRQGQVEAPFFQDLKRALLCLNPELLTELAEYRQQRRAEAAQLEIQMAPENNIVASESLNLSSLRLALVGGHEATRREVIRELQEVYCLKDVVEISPSSEAYVDRNIVQAKIINCHLIAVITGYMGHDLSQIVSALKKDRALLGEVLLLSCRGKSGVIREIINWWTEQK